MFAEGQQGRKPVVGATDEVLKKAELVRRELAWSGGAGAAHGTQSAGSRRLLPNDVLAAYAEWARRKRVGQGRTWNWLAAKEHNTV